MEKHGVTGADTNSSSHKVLGLGLALGVDLSDSKDPFVDYKKQQMSEKMGFGHTTMNKFDTHQSASTFYGKEKSRFRVFEDYSMEEEEQRS